MIDVLLIAVVGVVTWTVAAEGVVGATLIFFSVLFAGLLTMNFFEPLAILLESFSSNASWVALCDITAFLGLFGSLVFGFRAATEKLSPTFIFVPTLVDNIGRWAFAAATGYVSMAILLTSLHTSPFPREFIGFKPERKNLFEIAAPDRQWLGFVQYASEMSLRRGGESIRIFDGPQLSLPGQQNTIWPSFPIRYAYRRQMIASGVASNSAAPAAPVPVSAPATGGGGGGPNF
ncbi:MAG: CvpA family protein [Planctomycetota bacterium]|nr:CvpA family protein [Planctomycetota bacterium]MDA1214359.1 CvpA family protein [Planctomycetota bacterium]